MDLKTVLQVLNVLFLGLFGAASGKMINEWRKSREERHQADLARLASEATARMAISERVKATDQHEIEKRDLQIAKLTVENDRLTQARSERMELLEEQVRVLRSQAPAGVAADIDGLIKVNERQLLIRQRALEECEAARSEELSKYQATLGSKEVIIEQLKTHPGNSMSSTESDICLQSILAPPQRHRFERMQRSPSPPAKASVSLLLAQLKGYRFVDFTLRLVGGLVGERVLEYAIASDRLAEIGDPVVPELEELLSEQRDQVKFRAVLTLRRINSEKANEVLNRHQLNV
jgi:hypothetical protein